MSICLYIFIIIMTLVSVFVMFAAINAYLKSHDKIFDMIAYLEKQKERKSAEWEDEYREEDLQTRFAFYTYKDEPDILYLSNLFVEELSRGAGLGTRILKAAEKVAETIGATSICVKVKQDSPANKWYRKNGYGYKTFEGEYDWLEKTLEYLKPNKPAEWSEEDARKLRDSIRIIEDSDLVKSITEYYKQFLESLPERFNPTPKQEWSEEDEAMYNSIICEVVKEGMNLTEEQANWLKYLRPQPKQKDRYQEGFQDGVYEGRRKALEEYNKSVAYRCGDFNHKLSCYEGGPCTNPFFDCINCPRRGNSTVKTYTSPNTTEYQPWKPSEEQMTSLLCAEGYLRQHKYCGVAKDIAKLYDDLKKMM